MWTVVESRLFDYCTEHYGPLSFYGDSSMKLIEIGMVAAVTPQWRQRDGGGQL